MPAVGAAAVEAAGEHDARQARAGAGDHVDHHLVPVHVDAGVPGGLAVAAQGVEVAAQGGLGGEEPQRHGGQQRQDRADGQHAKERGVHEAGEARGEAVDAGGVGDDEHEAEVDRLRAQSDDEGMQAGLVNQKAVHRADQRAHQHAHHAGQHPGQLPVGHADGRHHAAQAAGGRYAQVDVAKEDGEELAQRQQNVHRRLAQDLGHGGGREDGRGLGNHQHHQKQEHDAHRAELLPVAGERELGIFLHLGVPPCRHSPVEIRTMSSSVAVLPSSTALSSPAWNTAMRSQTLSSSVCSEDTIKTALPASARRRMSW